MGLFPYIFTSRSHMVFTLTLSLPFWLGQMFYGWINNINNLLIHLIPQNTPFILMPFIVIIELISSFIRPVTLSIRASANIIAGHLLVSLLSSAAQNFLLFLPITIIFQLALTSMELAVALIQAYVFSVLITLYSSEII